MRGLQRGVAGIMPVAAALLGLALFLGAAFTYQASPFEALFIAGLGAILLGVGGVARVSIPAATICGSAGFVMILVAVGAPSIL
jgi:hypothetical protein